MSNFSPTSEIPNKAGSDIFPETEVFIKYLLTNMWGESWEYLVEIVLIDPPKSKAEKLINYFVINSGKLRLFILNSETWTAEEYLNNKYIGKNDITIFENRRSEQYTRYKGMAAWINNEKSVELLHSCVRRLEPYGRYVILCDPTKIDIGTFDKNTQNPLSAYQVHSLSKNFGIFTKEASDWHHKHKEFLRPVTSFPLHINDYFCKNRPVNIACQNSYIPKAFYYPESEGISEEHFAPYSCDISARFKLIDNALLHNESGCVFTSEGVHIVETSQWVEFQSNKIAGFYNGPDTGWRLWQHARVEADNVLEGPHFVALGAHPTNYYHWMIDIAPKIWMYDHALAAGLIPADTKLVVPRLRLAFQRDFMAMLQLPKEQVITLDPGYTHLREAYIPALYDNNKKEKWRGRPQQFYCWLRRKASNLVSIEKCNNPLLYISRTDTTKRILSNENEIIPILEKKGFRIFSTAGKTLKEQIQAAFQAQVVVGIHGAGLTNIIFSPLDSVVAEIRSEKVRDNGYRIAAGLRGSTYRCFKGDAVRSRTPTNPVFDIRVEPENFRTFISDITYGWDR